jgi:hypothetical protein
VCRALIFAETSKPTSDARCLSKIEKDQATKKEKTKKRTWARLDAAAGVALNTPVATLI